ncbi:MAG: Undecaprenyl-phosphate alpha-N-acetylglucosaminyl 1-phosphate transferase [Pseudomonadales bacterium]|nr:Undecaprenyl-phosphate alpha-N-acetylglucosaminyl 1-phosphate transferase [Pseudomonadales bacterium]
MESLYSFTVALFVSIALMPVMMRIAPVLGLIDNPSEARKIHSRIMPRNGGLAIIAGALAPLAFLLPHTPQVMYLAGGAAVILVFGIADDLYSLNHRWKLVGQALATIVVMGGGVVIRELPLLGVIAPDLVAYPLTMLFMLGVVNGVNFSDGMDGLAAGSSLLALLLIFVLAMETGNDVVMLISLTVAGGVLGFLRYNTFPAQIFMGDAGSQFLGFVIACLAILVTQAESSALSRFLPVLILGLPILDIIQVLPVRWYKRLPWPGPDREHLHHQIFKLNLQQFEAVAIIYVMQLLLLSGAFLLRFAADGQIAIFYAAYAAVVLGFLLWAHWTGWRIRPAEEVDPQRERRRTFLRRFAWLHHHGAQITEVLLAGLFLLITAFVWKSAAVGPSLVVLLSVTVLLSLVLGSRFPAGAVRLVVYTTGIALAHLIAVAHLNATQELLLNGCYVALVLFLAVAIRVTRRDTFRLDTQDLLILTSVLLLPLLPFDSLSQYEVGKLALRSAVVMYACEFVIAKRGVSHLVAQLSSTAVAAVLLLPMTGAVR